MNDLHQPLVPVPDWCAVHNIVTARGVRRPLLECSQLRSRRDGMNFVNDLGRVSTTNLTGVPFTKSSSRFVVRGAVSSEERIRSLRTFPKHPHHLRQCGLLGE